MNIRSDSSAWALYSPRGWKKSLAANSSEIPAQNVPPGPCRILVPINIGKCPLEVFSFIREFNRPGVSVDLLHVVDSEPTGDVSLEQDLKAAKEHLVRLADRFIPAGISTSTNACVGKPSEKILACAKEYRADLIVLTSYNARAVAPDDRRDGIIGEVLKSAPCNVSLLQVRTFFDCETQWHLVEDVVAALNYLGLLKPLNRWQPAASGS